MCAVNASIELRDFFDEIKVDWIDLWRAKAINRTTFTLGLISLTFLASCIPDNADILMSDTTKQ